MKPNAKTPRAASTSAKVHMPVERITVSARRAISSRNGPFVMSPEDTLMVFIANVPINRSKLSVSNGVDRKVRPRRAAWAANALWSSIESSSKRNIGRALLIVSVGCVWRGQRARTKSLKLDSVDPSIGSCIDERQRYRQRSVVIDASFCNDE